MEKIIFILFATLFSLWGRENTILDQSLQKECLQCHTQQQIPSEMIYRRYLLKYSSKALIRKKIFAYFKAPSPEVSIMPAPFFKKFPIKKRSSLDDQTLKELIDAYIRKFDVDKKIYIIPEKTD